MKILIVIPTIGELYGGPSKIVVEVAQALANAGVNVDIVTTSINGSNSKEVPLRVWVKTDNYRIQYFPYWGIKAQRKMGSGLWDARRYEFSFSLIRWLFHNIQEYDIVYTISIFSLVVQASHWICQIKKVPYVVNPQGMLEPWALAYKAWKKQLFYRLLTKPSLQRASAIFTSASSEAKNIKSLSIKTAIFTIPNGINRHEFELMPSPEVFYAQFPHTRNKSLIIFLGRIDPKKGLDLLAEAFAKVYSLYPNVHLIVAGQDNIGFLSTAQSYFKKRNCLQAVTFTGMLSGTVKHSALTAASLYVAPSYSEGFSMSILEGMASGLPCIFTTGCNFPEAETAHAAKIVGISAEEIEDALLYYLRNPDQAKELGNRARGYILGEYTWDSIATKMVKLYRTVLGEDIGVTS